MSALPEKAAHSKFSASGAHGWMTCPGKLAMEAGKPDNGSQYADEGTAAHTLASMYLDDFIANGAQATPLQGYVGRVIKVESGRSIEVTKEMADFVEEYCDGVLIASNQPGAVRLVEQTVNYHETLGVPEGQAFGTADFVALIDDLILITDLKYGMGVRVYAEGNEQMQLYALGALYEFGMLGEFKRVRMVIHQPRLGHLDEWEISVDELKAFGLKAKAGAQRVSNALGDWANNGNCYPDGGESAAMWLHPDEKACRFCKAKATCPALAAEVRATVHHDASTPVDFDDLTVKDAEVVKHYPTYAKDRNRRDPLGAAFAKLDLIESWCKAVRAEAERRLFAGVPVDGLKLVEGKRGNRAWTDKDAAEAALKSMRLRQDEMYSFTLIGPAGAEKLLKKDNPRRWASLQPLIGQAEGKPSVAFASDPRPALSVQPTADAFDVVTQPAAAAAGAHPFRS